MEDGEIKDTHTIIRDTICNNVQVASGRLAKEQLG